MYSDPKMLLLSVVHLVLFQCSMGMAADDSNSNIEIHSFDIG